MATENSTFIEGMLVRDRSGVQISSSAPVKPTPTNSIMSPKMLGLRIGLTGVYQSLDFKEIVFF
tara:strand:- start:11399 stop:11590 length:192 start_codon:yes stop_codon:yes gene_type:complete